MIRLAKMPTNLPDGYSGGRTGPSVAFSSELTPTESAADRRGFAVLPGDWVAEHLGEMFAAARRARLATAHARNAARLVEGRGDQRVGRQTTGGDCLACGRFVSGAVNDKLKGGYCQQNPGCSSAWQRFREAHEKAGSEASPVQFRKWRLAKLGES